MSSSSCRRRKSVPYWMWRLTPRWYSPKAPLQIDHGQVTSTWSVFQRISPYNGTEQVLPSHRFDVYGSDHVNRREDEDGLRRAASMLNGLIQEEHQKHGIPYSRIIVGGISQGGAVSLLTAVTTSHPIGGVFVLSSYVTLRKKIPEVHPPVFH